MSRRLLLALLLLAAAPAAAQDPLLARAKAQRYAGDLAGAEANVRRVLAARPNDYLALYNMGLIEEARARDVPSGPERWRRLKLSAAWLERARAARPADSPDATIFNTLGAVYIAMGDLSAAERALGEGRAHEAKLSPASKGKLYSNLGLVHALKGEQAKAVPAWTRAAALGNRNAAANLARAPVSAPR